MKEVYIQLKGYLTYNCFMNLNFFISPLFALFLSSSLYADVWNSPHPKDKASQEVLFSSFSLPYKHLDPVISYSKRESVIISNIYEPVVGYNYLKRPYVLEPLTLTSMPNIVYLDTKGNRLEEENKNVAFSQYTFSLRQDIFYQNHPSFVKDEKDILFYDKLTKEELDNIHTLDDFNRTATRKLKAQDYVYAIKRMAVRQNHSPILDIIQEYLVGLEEYSKEITQIAKEKKKHHQFLDLRKHPIEGVKILDDYHFSLTLKRKYPQFLYWMSMNFFAPIPWEADRFYHQEGLISKNITLNEFPVGTGAYYLAENNPNRQLRLLVNPNYHDMFYPTLSQEEIDRSSISKNLLKDSGKKLPFIKEIIYALEKESIPSWNKFLQGYYDASGISSEAFDQAVQVSSLGNMGLSDEMRSRGIQLKASVESSIFYLAFNMVDPVVGGYSPSAKKLRQAISIAQNEEEYISIFTNERGIPAQSPLPPGIFGHLEGKAGCNLYVYNWVEGECRRKSIEEAKKLLAEAGYPNAVSSKTGKPLVLNYDSTASGPDDRALMDWRRKQFAKLGIQLVIRGTDYNRFQDKVREGRTQLFSWGWNADYPDPENFLFLLYGGNASVTTNGTGVNSANYNNPEYNKLFEEVKTMKNSKKRLEKIREMIKVAQEDAPWVWGMHPKSLALYHEWFKNVLPHTMSDDTLKYKRVDATLRAKRQEEWNQPILLPLGLFALFLLLISYPLYRAYVNRQRAVIA